MVIRDVTPGDNLAAIGEIYAQSWKAAYRGMVPQEYLDTLDGSRWERQPLESGTQTLVLMDREIYAGVSAVAPARDPAMAGWGELISIYLRPEYFGQGHGARLLEAALARLRAMGFRKIYLIVLQENEKARNFYEKHGFTFGADAGTIEIAGKVIPEVRYQLETL